MNPIIPASSVPTSGSMPGVTDTASTTKSLGAKSNSGGGFSQLIDHFVQQTNESQVVSDQSIEALVTGKTDNVQQVVMAVANAEMSFQLFMEIRNKLIDSYNELMRMQF